MSETKREIDPDKLSEQTEQIFRNAHDLAQTNEHETVDVAHFLTVLLADKNGPAQKLITKAGGNVQTIALAVAGELASLFPATSAKDAAKDVSDAVTAAYIAAEKRAGSDKLIESDQFLLGLLENASPAIKSALVSAKLSLPELAKIINGVDKPGALPEKSTAAESQKTVVNMNGKLTKHANLMYYNATKLAQEKNHAYISAVHMLESILSSDLAKDLIKNVGGTIDPIKDAADAELKKQIVAKTGDKDASATLHYADDLVNAYALAEKDAGDGLITTPLFLLALLKTANPQVQDAIGRARLNLPALQKEIEKMSKGQEKDNAFAEAGYNTIQKYCRDLTTDVRLRKVPEIVGREDEIRRVLEILMLQQKPNALVTGDDGVGKTSIIQGVAQRIVSGDVPEALKNKRILLLDPGAVMIGCTRPNEFEERIKAVIKEITANDDFILFIDDVETALGKRNESVFNAADVLRLAMVNDGLSVLATASTDNYNKYVLRDSGFASQFQPVHIAPASAKETLSILRELSPKLEVHHGIKIDDTANVAAARLAERHITDQFLPQSAIDLLQEAAAKRHAEKDTKPVELDKLERQLLQQAGELEFLKSQGDVKSKKFTALEADLKETETLLAPLKKSWEDSQASLAEIQKLREELNAAQIEAKTATASGDQVRAATLQFGTIPDLQKKVETAEAAIKDSVQSHAVGEAEIAAIVSRRVPGVSASRLVESEAERILNLPKVLAERVVGQDDAVEGVSGIVQSRFAGTADTSKPPVFVFFGPSGTGKTELVKALCDELYNSEDAMTRIDCGEYMEKESVSRLNGPPPGFIGYEEGGQLTEAVHRRPYQIILIDEIEKAHPDFFNALLPVLDEGQNTDSKGRKVNYKNTIIIMTSNIGADLMGNLSEGVRSLEVKDQVMNEVKKRFKPEVINRMDNIIFFNRLFPAMMGLIADIQMRRMKKQIKAEKDITVEWDNLTREWLARHGYDPAYGARPMKRLIEKAVRQPMAKPILRGEIKEGQICKISVNAKGDALTFTGVNPPANANDETAAAKSADATPSRPAAKRAASAPAASNG